MVVVVVVVVVVKLLRSNVVGTRAAISLLLSTETDTCPYLTAAMLSI